nr:Muscarinic acetylcholine receptor M2 [Hymenolepis microstoma]
MQSASYLGSIILILQAILETSSQGISIWKPDSDDNWAPSSQSIRYSKWAEERRSTSTTRAYFRTTTPGSPEIEKVFRIYNATDLLFRYHEAEKKQKGNGSRSSFNTPIFETTTNIPPLTKPNGLAHADVVVYGKASTVIIIILTVIASSVTIGGNVLVLAAFYLERTLRIPTNYFIASLAVTDVLIGIFSMNLYTLYLLLGYWPLGRELCDLWLGLDHTLCLTSQYTVFFITLDRFFSVKIPAKYRNWRTGNKILIMIAITWILPSSIFFTTLLGWPHFSESNFVRQKLECYAEFSSNPMFNTILTITYFWITLTVMTGLYIGIYMVALRLQKKSEKKKAKVKNYLNMYQNASGKSVASMQNETEMDFAESYHLASSNETGARVTSGEFDSTPIPQQDSQKPLQVSTKLPLDQKREENMPYCGLVKPIRDVVNTNNSKPLHNKTRMGVYTNECFSESNSYPAGNCSPKASPTSITESVFVDIRSPHLSDPEIPESTKMFDNNLYTFPSSPAVHIFNEMENCSEESSLKLSFAYSNPNQSYNNSTGELPPKFEKDQASDKSFNVFDYVPPSYECRPSATFNRNSSANQMAPNERSKESNNTTQVCPFSESSPQKANMDARRVSKASAARVAQIWQDRLMMQNDKYQKVNHDGKFQSTQSNNGRNLENNSSGSRTTSTSKNPLRSGKKKREFNSYLHRGQDSSTRGANQAPMERGRTANRARKALKTISLILGAFVICWTPYHIVILIKGFCDNPKNAYSCVNSHIYTMAYWMCYMNSPINPFCYALANAQFKQAFLRILRFDFKRR